MSISQKIQYIIPDVTNIEINLALSEATKQLITNANEYVDLLITIIEQNRRLKR